MRIGFQVIFWIIVLNLVCGLANALKIAGTEYTTAPSGSGDPEDYQDRFDPEAYVNKTQPSVWESLPFLGNVITTLLPFWDAIRFTIFGFPSLLIEFGAMIPDPSGRAAYTLIVAVVLGTQSVIVLAWIVQSWSGRSFQD